MTLTYIMNLDLALVLPGKHEEARFGCFGPPLRVVQTSFLIYPRAWRAICLHFSGP
jgi:hypothetical protein